MDTLKPNEKEREVLLLFFNRFYNLYDEIVNNEFSKKDAKVRFYKLRDAFSVYKELLNYEPIKAYIEYMKKGGRPFFEGIIADDLFSFIRNLLLHFPVFETWDEVYINKNLATWSKSGQINKFLSNPSVTFADGFFIFFLKNVLYYLFLWLPIRRENFFKFFEKFGKTVFVAA